MKVKRKKLAIIGAGPKAMAIASKAVALKEIGLDAPEIVILERREVGANWTGDSGFTNGKLLLGTSPEKDVGFPYQSTGWEEPTNEVLNDKMREFSWQTFLIHSKQYSDWVDRGRPHPQHRQWAEYLRWVYSRVAPHVTFQLGEVQSLAIENDAWTIRFLTPSGKVETLEADGVMVTGPGQVKQNEDLPSHENVLTVETFWKRYQTYREAGPRRIALVGAGENAASVAIALTQYGDEQLIIDVLSPEGMIFSRGESFRENRVYSHAVQGNWKDLSHSSRREFIYRTDRGVFSQYAQRVLDQAKNIRVIPGRMTGISPLPSGALQVLSTYDQKTRSAEYDDVIVATGADPLGFLRGLFSEGTEKEILRRSGIDSFCGDDVEAKIDCNLTLEGLTPRLHLPMLSGVSQGPGFANLSCLGRLSDRVLRAYVGKE